MLTWLTQNGAHVAASFILGGMFGVVIGWIAHALMFHGEDE